MQESVTIRGILTDCNGTPIANGEVGIKDAGFTSIYSTKTNQNGEYFLQVEKGTYFALYAVEGYIERHLEYWCWNLPIYEDMEINMQIDGLELYGINAFMIPRQRPLIPIMIYFRPMSLKRTLPILHKMNDMEVLDVAPDFTAGDLKITVDGESAQILSVVKVPEIPVENAKQTLFGYLVEVCCPVSGDCGKPMKIDIYAQDRETGEKGMGSLLWEKPKAFDYFGSKDV